MALGRCIIAAVWIDTHCHLDAAEFDADRDGVVAAARSAGVATIVLPAVDAGNFDRVRELAHRHRLAYALGIHPMCTGNAGEADLAALRARLEAHRDDPQLVAVGEIGLDHFVPGLDRERQAGIFAAQLTLAREFDLPVLLHVRRAVDSVLKQLRTRPVQGGIAHAFNGSEQQAGAFVELGFRLGFGGALDGCGGVRRETGEFPRGCDGLLKAANLVDEAAFEALRAAPDATLGARSHFVFGHLAAD